MPRTLPRLLAPAFVLVFGLTACGQDKARPATIKVMIPESPTQTSFKFENKDVPHDPKAAKAGVHVLTTADLPPGKPATFKVEAVIVPNNYTKIFRTREVMVKAGDEVTVDVQTEDKSKPDRIEVRWVPTPDDIVDAMCKFAKVGKEDVVHDYGCGDAVMLIRPIQVFGAKKGFGNDIDPEMVKKANENIEKAKLKDKVTVVQGDILKMTAKDCEEATVVLLYIGDDLGAKLEPVLRKALKPGTRVVSHRFGLGEWQPTQTKKVIGQDGDEYVLHLWVVPEKKK
jgi:uncharacterized protein (TIGR03000 family)